MRQEVDIIVIGAGHNGLVCAAYLARAGLKVILLERRQVVGGCVVTEEVWPGYKVSTASYVNALFQSKIIRDLDLRRHGFEMIPLDHMFVPFPDGRYFVYWDDEKKTCQEISKFSKRDAEVFPEFNKFRKEAAAFFRELLWMTPPNPTSGRLRDLKSLLAIGWKFRKMGKMAFRFADLLIQSGSDFLDQWFESDELKAVLVYHCSSGSFAGPRTPGTAYALLHRLIAEGKGAGGWGFVRGGMGGLAQSIARAAEQHGASIRTGVEVRHILVEGGRAVGVVLNNGEEAKAKGVVSNADPKRTFLRMMDSAELDPEFLQEVKNIKTFSSAFKINFAIEEPLTYTAFNADEIGFPYASFVHIAPSVAYLEKAFDDARYGRASEKPFLSPLVPTLADSTLAPKGKHILNVYGGHAPYRLKDTTWDRERDSFADRVVETIAEYAPNIKGAITHRQILMPPDLEEIFGLTEGNIYHGELSLDQLFFMRPVPGYADYRTPIRGLYLCGSGVHPGGGVTGVPGHNAAREILRDWKTRKLR